LRFISFEFLIMTPYLISQLRSDNVKTLPLSQTLQTRYSR